MDTLIIVCLVPIIFLVTIGAIAYAFTSKRNKAIEQIANELGFKYQYKDDSLCDKIKLFELNSIGIKGDIENIISGSKNGINFHVFDFVNKSKGSSNTTWKYSVVLLKNTNINLPRFILKPKLIIKQSNITSNPPLDIPEIGYMLQSDDLSLDEKIRKDNGYPIDFYKNKKVITEGKGNYIINYQHFLRVKDTPSFLDDAIKASSTYNI